MTLLGIYTTFIDVEELPFNPLVQLSCVGCSKFLNCYSCPFFTPHVLAFSRAIRKKSKHALLLVAWFDVAGRVNKMYSKNRKLSVIQLLTLAQLQAENLARRTMPKIIREDVKRLEQARANIIFATGFGGGCSKCRKCNIHCNLPCRYPTSREPPSPEGLGIDVYTLLRKLEIPVEVPPRRFISKTVLIFLKRKVNVDLRQDELRPADLLPEISSEVRKSEEEDKTKLNAVLKRAVKLNLEIKVRDCNVTCPLKGSVKCSAIRKYFKNLEGREVSVLELPASEDLRWVRQSYMRHVSHLCSTLNVRPLLRQRAIESLCSIILARDVTYGLIIELC